MKLKTLILLLLAGTLAYSCRKEFREETSSSSDNMSELRVADSFNWKTTADYHFSITANTNGIVRIQSEEGVVFHRANLSSHKEYNTKVAIPTYVKSILVRQGNATVMVELNSESINLTL